MKKIAALILPVFGLWVFISWGKTQLASTLLTWQLSSMEQVNQNISSANTSSEVVFNNNRFNFDPQTLADLLSWVPQGGSQVLGDSSGRWIEVNLSQQRLYAWDNGSLVYNYLISSGRWAPTPTGNYNIWIKLASTRMRGGSQALGTYYDLPNVPCTMYFYKGYGLHGAYWHNNFGHPMSHGCINMRPSEACQLFSWASVGTRVSIHY